MKSYEKRRAAGGGGFGFHRCAILRSAFLCPRTFDVGISTSFKLRSKIASGPDGEQRIWYIEYVSTCF